MLLHICISSIRTSLYIHTLENPLATASGSVLLLTAKLISYPNDDTALLSNP